MSVAVEENILEVDPIMRNYQNIPRTFLPTVYRNLADKNYYDVQDIEDIKVKDSQTYAFMLGNKAKVSLFRAIKKEDGQMIGFIGVESEKTPEDYKKLKKNVDKTVERITGALFDSPYYRIGK